MTEPKSAWNMTEKEWRSALSDLRLAEEEYKASPAGIAAYQARFHKAMRGLSIMGRKHWLEGATSCQNQ